MVDIRKVPVTWQTGAGGVGYSVFYTLDADDATANLGTFFNAIKSIFPSSVSWSIPSTGDKLDVSSGVLTGTWTGGTAASITSSGSGTYAAGTGMYVKWATAGIKNGRKVQGRTFLAPVLSSVYDNDGTITGTNLTLVGGAATTLVAANKLGVYSRPTTAFPNSGSFSAFTGSSVPDRVTSLRTRRS